MQSGFATRTMVHCRSEQVDNGKNLQDISLSHGVKLSVRHDLLNGSRPPTDAFQIKDAVYVAKPYANILKI
ncbi:hypothetical protein MUB24_14800 [Lederbergia sp. NSJ-179]|uniref:hypothetical protein n=1 Tax=Lederbergia sp. NSJ-179 TaxID=2931402 RepID=UPI001FD286AF|nr:hypothetical protein [Lederbergia sp. NSJ-179]MCJ7842147.1 hypothetical protein [Lederbergia sp. NSJ-179]